ncbi:MAG: ribonuclease G [Gammaproteobacteria bacterium]|nr:MAG: ribonuclease G [Gammaproteobacteria bacterium]
MSDEILINVTPPETRVAVIENGVVQELFIERTHCQGLVGNIYRGRVSRVLPGMQAAFVDIGLERAAFLHVSDVTGCYCNSDTPESQNIEAHLREGQPIVVQVNKEPLGTKGARVSTDLSFPSLYMVYMPYCKDNCVSQRIGSETERERLVNVMDEFSEGNEAGAFIARTVAEEADQAALQADMRFLLKVWKSLKPQIKSGQAGLLHQDLSLGMRVLRDFYRDQVDKIRVDSRETFQKLRLFAEEFLPEKVELIEHYTGSRPIFDLYRVEEEIQKALDRKVQLKSGGHLVFDQTEAMTTVDVNTGGFVGRRSLEETIFKTNMEAVQSIARQLRLRNLGGIIILDFIDMQDDAHKQQVLNALESCLAKDYTRTSMSEVSALGLVEMTRKRSRESLEHMLCEPCPVCAGRGTLKTPETTSFEIFREITRDAKQYNTRELLVLASNEVVDRLLDEESGHLTELEDFIGIRIRLRAEAQYSQEQYDVILL